MQDKKKLYVLTEGQKLFNITDRIRSFVSSSKINDGLLNISILHTSASLLIQENADSDVQNDLLNFLDKLVPMNKDLYIHNEEGKDDMPAHIKSALTQSNLTITVEDKNLILGVWQGIYLFEHRIDPQKRTVLVHLIGE
tara:strand:+ start:635 stop:1051 length:417 start_codon:yes stop_codon:yes gene_type:complete